MYRKLITLMVLLFLFTFLFGCQHAPSEMQKDIEIIILEKTQGEISVSPSPDMEPKVVHVEQIIEGKTVTLHLSADVLTYPADQEFCIYDAKPIAVDHDAWRKFFFSDTDIETLEHYYDNWGEKPLLAQEITDDIVQRTFGYICSGKTAYYLLTNASFRYIANGRTQFDLNHAGDGLFPENSEKAVTIGNEFIAFVGGDRFRQASCTAGVTSPDDQQVCVVSYERIIDGLSMVQDSPVTRNIVAPPQVAREEVVVWVIDDEIDYASGVIREISLREKHRIISVEEALKTLATYADIVNAYTEDFIDGKTEKNEFKINRVELMYYPMTTDDAALTEQYAGRQGAYALYKPVWYIASGLRVNTNFEYVMIIDAITGEIIT